VIVKVVRKRRNSTRPAHYPPWRRLPPAPIPERAHPILFSLKESAFRSEHIARERICQMINARKKAAKKRFAEWPPQKAGVCRAGIEQLSKGLLAFPHDDAHARLTTLEDGYAGASDKTKEMMIGNLWEVVAAITPFNFPAIDSVWFSVCDCLWKHLVMKPQSGCA